MNLKEIIAKARQNAPAGMTIEVEVTSATEAAEAVKAGADIIMLDNMSIKEMKPGGEKRRRQDKAGSFRENHAG